MQEWCDRNLRTFLRSDPFSLRESRHSTVSGCPGAEQLAVELACTYHRYNYMVLSLLLLVVVVVVMVVVVVAVGVVVV